MLLSLLLVHAAVASAASAPPPSPPCLPPVNTTAATLGLVQSSVVLEMDNWDTHKLITYAAKILLEERLGLRISLRHHAGGTEVYQRAGTGAVDANLEVWGVGKDDAAARWVCESRATCAHQAEQWVTSRPLGFAGDVGVFLAYRNMSLLETYLLDYWRAYRNPKMARRIPPADFVQDASGRINCTSQFCASDGRFYARPCGGNGMGHGNGTAGNVTAAAERGCRLYIAMDPAWDTGVFEAAFDALNLPMVATYVGATDQAVVHHINRSLLAGYPAALFYHWRPSVLVAAWNTQVSQSSVVKLGLPNDDTSFCELKWGTSWCQQTSQRVQKLLNAKLEARVPSAWSLLNSFHISNAHIDTLLVKSPSTSGSAFSTHEQAACAWLTQNRELWAPWISAAQEVAQRRTNVTIALVWPQLVTELEGTEQEKLEQAAVQLALERINADSSLLPSIRLQPFIHPSGVSVLRSLGADTHYSGFQTVAARQMVADLVQAGAVAAVGAGWSSENLVLAPHLRAAGLPIISHSATAGVLSNSTEYPFFARACPADTLQGAALADLIAHYGWNSVGVVHCDDAYCVGLLRDLKSNLAQDIMSTKMVSERGMQSQDSIRAVVSEIHNEIASCKEKDASRGEKSAVLVLLVHDDAAESITREIRQLSTSLNIDLLATESIGSSIPGPFIRNSGMISLRLPISSGGEVTAALGQKVGLGFVLTAYDATWALAHAIHGAIQRGADLHAGSFGKELLRDLRNVSFNGASGAVSFDSNLDRKMGYEIVRDTAHAGRIQIGKWTPPRELQLDMGVVIEPKILMCQPKGLKEGNDDLSTGMLLLIIASVLLPAATGALYVYHRRRAVISRVQKTFTTYTSASDCDDPTIVQEVVKDFDTQFSSRAHYGPNTKSTMDAQADSLVKRVKNSRVLVLLLTRSVLTRPNNLVEIYCALKSRCPIVPVAVWQGHNNRHPILRRSEYTKEHLHNLHHKLYDEQFMKDTWGQPTWSDAEENTLAGFKTATEEEIQGMTEQEAAIHIPTPDGSSLTLEIISAELKVKEFQPETSAALYWRPRNGHITKYIKKAMLNEFIARIKRAITTGKDVDTDDSGLSNDGELNRRPKRDCAFASLRFDGVQEEKAAALKEAMEQRGKTLEIMNIDAGDCIFRCVFETIKYCDTFIVFGSARYGQNTGNPACTYCEYHFAHNNRKRIIAIRLIPQSEQFEELQAQVIFSMNSLFLDWNNGVDSVADDIVRAMESGGRDAEARASESTLISNSHAHSYATTKVRSSEDAQVLCLNEQLAASIKTQLSLLTATTEGFQEACVFVRKLFPTLTDWCLNKTQPPVTVRAASPMRELKTPPALTKRHTTPERRRVRVRIRSPAPSANPKV
jgi:ABC-type branched-subunit amino acid transport system substrate-binding protein/ABC-type proline/glycine betaine transport system substrate-binding protein